MSSETHKSEIVNELKLGALPKHVAIIMDGNGRWAKQRHLPRMAGHREGLKAVRRTVKSCASMGIEVLTLFAFSSENWQRPLPEVSGLLNLFLFALQNEIECRGCGSPAGFA